MASWRLALTESRRWIAERRGGKLLGPDQLLFALEPLQDEDFDLAGAIGAELNRSGYRGHICGGDGVAKLVAVQGFRARDRIGKGPWFNWSFAQLGAPQNALISVDLADLHGDTLIQAQRGNNFFKQSARNEHGEVIHGIGDPPPIQHEMLTGSKWDGRAYTDSADHTCNNWTSSSTGSAQVGHSDRIGNGSSWNSSNATKGCSQADLESTGGTGLFYCFAIN